MTTDDYILLSTYFIGKTLDSIPLERFAHLVELGILKQDDIVSRQKSDSFGDDFAQAPQNKAQTKHEKNQALIQALIIERLKENPNLTQTEIVVAISKTRSAVQVAFAELQKKGLLRREGSKMNGIWVVEED